MFPKPKIKIGDFSAVLFCQKDISLKFYRLKNEILKIRRLQINLPFI